MPKVITKLLQHRIETFDATNTEFLKNTGAAWQNLSHMIERDGLYTKWQLAPNTININGPFYISDYVVAYDKVFQLPQWVTAQPGNGDLIVRVYVKLFQNTVDELLDLGIFSVKIVYNNGTSIVSGRDLYTWGELGDNLYNFNINNSTEWVFENSGTDLSENSSFWLTSQQLNEVNFGVRIQLYWRRKYDIEAGFYDPPKTYIHNSDIGIEYVQMEFEWKNWTSSWSTSFSNVDVLTRNNANNEQTIYLKGLTSNARRAVKTPNWSWDTTNFSTNLNDGALVKWRPSNYQLNYTLEYKDQNNVVQDGVVAQYNYINGVPNAPYDPAGIGMSYFYTDYLHVRNISQKLGPNAVIRGLQLEILKRPGTQRYLDTGILSTNKVKATQQTYPGYQVWDEFVMPYHTTDGIIGQNYSYSYKQNFIFEKQYNRDNIFSMWPIVFRTSTQNPSSLRGYEYALPTPTNNNQRVFGGDGDLWGIADLTPEKINDEKFGILLSALYAHNWNNSGIDLAKPVFSNPKHIDFGSISDPNKFEMGYDRIYLTIYYGSKDRRFEDFVSWGTFYRTTNIFGGDIKLTRGIKKLEPFSFRSQEIFPPVLLRYLRNIEVNNLINSFDLVNSSVNLIYQQFINDLNLNTLENCGNNIEFKFVSYAKDIKVNSEENVSSGIEISKSSVISPSSLISQEISSQQKAEYAFYQEIDMNYPILSDEKLQLEIVRQLAYDPVFLSNSFNPSYEMGYKDILALSQDDNPEPQYDLPYSSIDEDFLFTANNINLNYEQSSLMNKRLAGEGANPNTFKINTRTLNLEFNIPIRVESWGYLDSTFAAIYDYFIQGYKGNKNTFVSRLSSSMPSTITSTNSLVVDNVADFINLGNNFTAYIRSDDNSETAETIIVSSVNKSTRTLNLQSSTINSHTRDKTYIWAKPTNPASNREGSFSLYSLREGLLSGCMVDSITINIRPGQTIDANVNIKFTNLDRKYQTNIQNNFDNIVEYVNSRRPNYLINGSQVTIRREKGDYQTFGLGTYKDSNYFHGYQEDIIKDYQITEIILTFKNDLQPVYSLNSKTNNRIKDFQKNLEPYAYYSNGRSISGTIKYNSPIKPMLFAEKLSGPGNINSGGLKFNFGSFELVLPELVWTPENSNSNMDETQSKSVSFSVATKQLNFDPYFESTGKM